MPRTPHRRSRHAARGSALLLAIIIVAVLGIIGLAIVQRASSEGDAVAAKKLHDGSITCADAARDLLMSQFRAYGTSPVDMKLNASLGDRTMATGHYDNLNVTSVELVPDAKQGTFGATDRANRILGEGAMGGQVYRMTVMCSSPSPTGGVARQSEVEYLVRFGL